jgi:LIVCS family branched-chain amino acid:cation transporter
MRKFFNLSALSVGLAMFSMFFGAGNVIFPLAVGQYAGDKNIYAIFGLLLTAALMPIAGVVAMILFNGDTKQFFGRLGKWPGFFLSLIIISLLGPLGSTPRCIALAYTTLKSTFLDTSPYLFSACACAVIFIFSFRKNHILNLLGLILTPLLLASLVIIIGIGFFTKESVSVYDHTKFHAFLHGLKEGYNTMDLLASFFFSSTILTLLRLRTGKKENDHPLRTAMMASVIGAFFLGVIYVGFSYLAAFHAEGLQLNGKDELLALITMKIAGAHAGLLVCVIIALACLTTAIALISAFADFFQTQVLKEKISYELTLFLSLVATFFVATFEFGGIAAFLDPIVQLCYPGLIVLTLLNIAYRLKKFEPLKVPVFAAFALTGIAYFAF